jgi:hypothetical protein
MVTRVQVCGVPQGTSTPRKHKVPQSLRAAHWGDSIGEGQKGGVDQYDNDGNVKAESGVPVA